MNEPLLQVQSEVNGTTHIDIEEIRNFTNGLIYPLYFLDFETIGPAVPKYNGSRPYQQLVFQYSLHIQETLTSVIEHREYLADPSQRSKNWIYRTTNSGLWYQWRHISLQYWF